MQQELQAVRRAGRQPGGRLCYRQDKAGVGLEQDRRVTVKWIE